MIDAEDTDLWEPLDAALAALGGVSRNWFYRHKDDDGFLEYAEIGGRVKVNKASRRAYAEQRRAEAEASRQARLHPKPKVTRRGRPPLVTADSLER